MQWRKASRSADNGGHCVEVASADGARLVRDSKDPDGPWLALTPQGFRSLLHTLRRT
ncbi:DUF397 domain-containing protein [Spirillospora sp. CA-255316]